MFRICMKSPPWDASIKWMRPFLVLKEKCRIPRTDAAPKERKGEKSRKELKKSRKIFQRFHPLYLYYKI